MKMKVNEIFLSIQGEGLTTGFPTIFVRFCGCNLRCSYCDTSYSYNEGDELTIEEILQRVKALGYRRVCLTGGEPLLQDNLQRLLDAMEDYHISIETNGSVAVSSFNMRQNHTFNMDMKAPSSGESNKMLFENFDYLREQDEIKFVIGSREDYEWARAIIHKYHKKGILTISPVYGTLKSADIVTWILEDRLEARFQLQLHKIIWDPAQRGV